MNTASTTTAVPVKSFGIDVETRSKARLIRELGRLVSTVEIADGGEYREDRHYSQVHVTTKMTEPKLEEWLCGNSRIDYVGVFERSQEKQ